MWEEIIRLVHLRGVIETRLLGDICIAHSGKGKRKDDLRAVIPVDLQLAAERRGLIITSAITCTNTYRIRRRKYDD